LSAREEEIKTQRAAKFFNIDYDKFIALESTDSTQKELLITSAKSVFDTVSTQAFQLGYLMAVHSIVEQMLQPTDSYNKRKEFVVFISRLCIEALNAYFSPEDNVEHRTLTGFIKDPRASVFDSGKLGLRGLLLQSVKELNERQWMFFRYAILEIIHSKYTYKILLDILAQTDINIVNIYKKCLPKIANDILQLREKYVLAAVDTALKSPDFKQEIHLLKAKSSGEGKTADEIESIVKEKEKLIEQEVKEKCTKHLEASLGQLSKTGDILGWLKIVN